MGKLRIDVRERDRMTIEVVNRAEVEKARQERWEEMRNNPAPDQVVGNFRPTPGTVEFNFSAAAAYQREGGSTRDIADLILADAALLGEVAPEFSRDEIEINVIPKEG